MAAYGSARSTTNITADHDNADTFYGLKGYAAAPGTDQVFSSLVAPSSDDEVNISETHKVHENVNSVLFIDKPYNTVFACWGQSNDAGADTGNGYTTAPAGSYMYTPATAVWDDLEDPILGLGATYKPKLADNFITANPTKTVGFIDCGVYNTGICNDWGNRGPSYLPAIKAVRMAGGCDAMIFYGGETDMVESRSAAQTQEFTERLIDNIRADLNRPNLPIYFILPDWPVYSEPIKTAVRTGIQNAINNRDRVLLVADARGMSRVDTVHLSRSAQDTLADTIWPYLQQLWPLDVSDSSAVSEKIYVKQYNNQFYTEEQVSVSDSVAIEMDIMTGDWHNADCRWALLPSCLKAGSAPAAFNTGYFPIFRGQRSRKDENALLRKMSSGYGYNDGVLKFDTANSSDLSIFDGFTDLHYSNQFTLAAYINHPSNDNTIYVIYAEEQHISAECFVCYVTDGTVEMSIIHNGVTSNIYTDAALTPGMNVLHYVIDGETLKIYVNGTQAACSHNTGYLNGDLTYNGEALVGNGLLGSSLTYYPNADDIHWMALYDGVRSEADIQDDYENADTFYGLKAFVNNPGTDEVLSQLYVEGYTSIFDDVSITENITVSMVNPNIDVNIHDDISVTEQITNLIDKRPFASDSISVTENISILIDALTTVSDSVAVTENITIQTETTQPMTIIRPDEFDYTISDFVDSISGEAFAGTSISNLAITMVTYDDDNHTYVSGDVEASNLAYTAGAWALSIPASVVLRLPYNHYTIVITGDEIDPYTLEGDIGGSEALLVLSAAVSDSVTTSDSAGNQFDGYSIAIYDTVAIADHLAIIPSYWPIVVSDNIGVLDMVIQNTKPHSAGGELEGAFAKPVFTPPAFRDGKSFK
jgi:hypothetical protein